MEKPNAVSLFEIVGNAHVDQSPMLAFMLWLLCPSFETILSLISFNALLNRIKFHSAFNGTSICDNTNTPVSCLVNRCALMFWLILVCSLYGVQRCDLCQFLENWNTHTISACRCRFIYSFTTILFFVDLPASSIGLWPPTCRSLAALTDPKPAVYSNRQLILSVCNQGRSYAGAKGAVRSRRLLSI